MNTYIAIIFVVILAVLAVVVTGRSDTDNGAQVPVDAVSLEDTSNIGTVPEETVSFVKDDIGAVSGKALDLSGKGLTKVDESVFKKTALVTLDLSNNELEGALQSQVGQLKKLVSLDLSDNDFTGVPAEVGQLSKLRYLDLSNNRLTGLPYELGNLQNLEILDLRGNDYAEQDLATIRESLPATTNILTQ